MDFLHALDTGFDFPQLYYPPAPVRKNILVCGATGKQGRAVIHALHELDPTLYVLALTRSVIAPGAKSIASLSNVQLLEGDLNDADAVFRMSEPVWGVFCALPVSSKEEQQGKSLVDAAIRNGVRRFVYSSVDRGANSDIDLTPVHHFTAKYHIEKHLEAAAKDTPMSYAIIRPVAFFENFTPDFAGKAFATCLSTLSPDTRVQFVSTADVGRRAARALTSPTTSTITKPVSLAGDALTFPELQATFQERFNRPLPVSYSVLGWVARLLVPDFGRMLSWWESKGYGADVGACQRRDGRMMDFGRWLTHGSGFN